MLNTSFSVNLHVGRAKQYFESAKHKVQKPKIANKDHMSTCNCSQSMPQMKSFY